MDKVKCILLIDDDETTNFINELMILDMGVTERLLQAYNGKEGLEILQKHAEDGQCLPDLILLDINMPVMDGFDFLEAYQAMDFPGKRSVVIVMLTTSLNPNDVERVNKSGIADYVNKPLTEQNLIDLFNKHLSKN